MPLELFYDDGTPIVIKHRTAKHFDCDDCEHKKEDGKCAMIERGGNRVIVSTLDGIDVFCMFYNPRGEDNGEL